MSDVMFVTLVADPKFDCKLSSLEKLLAKSFINQLIMLLSVLSAKTQQLKSGFMATAVALLAATPSVYAQKAQLSESLQLPRTYMVNDSRVINGDYVVYRNISTSSDNVNPAGKNEAGFAVYASKDEYKDNLVQGFIDVFDVATLKLKRSFGVRIPGNYGVQNIEQARLTDKGVILLLNSEEFKDKDGKGYNVTLRSMSYDGVVGADSMLVDRITKDYYDKFTDHRIEFNVSTGDFYRYRSQAPSFQKDRNNHFMQFQRMNIFDKKADNPITATLSPRVYAPRIQFLDSKPYLIYGFNKVDSCTVMPIFEGTNFRTDGLHFKTRTILVSEPSATNGDKRYVFSIDLNDNKNVTVTGYRLAFSGNKLTSTLVVETELDRKAPEVDNFIDEFKKNRFGGHIASLTETPTGPAFLLNARRFVREGNLVMHFVTSGCIVEATGTPNAPKVIYHTYKTVFDDAEAFGTKYFGNMEYAGTYRNGMSSFNKPKPYLISFGPDLSMMTEVGEITQTYVLRKVGSNYNLIRPVDNDLPLNVARFTGKRMYSATRCSATSLTLDPTGAVVPAESAKFEGSNKRAANLILPSRCILPDGSVIGFLQNSRTAQLIKL